MSQKIINVHTNSHVGHSIMDINKFLCIRELSSVDMILKALLCTLSTSSLKYHGMLKFETLQNWPYNCSKCCRSAHFSNLSA